MFFVTPGPVWVSVMEATRTKTVTDVWNFYTKTFLTANLTIQAPQAIICVIFVDLVSKMFTDIGIWLYGFGGLYILYLAFKVLNSKQSNKPLDLSYYNLALVMLLSPKIWLLFPTGAVIATQLQQGVLINSAIYAATMLVVSSVFYFIYVSIGKIGTKVLKDNFAYLSFVLLLMFSAFLLSEVWFSI